MTRNGVEYDFTKSIYRVEMQGKTFVFSSHFNKRRFEERAGQAVVIYANSIFKKYGVTPKDTYPALHGLYKEIEKRGYLIENGVK